MHRGHLDRGGRAHALALGHGRGDEQVRAHGRTEAALEAEDDESSGHVGGPLLVGVAGEEPARIVIGDEASARSEPVERHLGRPRRVARAFGQAGQTDDAVAAQACGHERGLAQGPLEHERAGIVGNAAHEVEAAGRAGDYDFFRVGEERRRPGPRHDRPAGEKAQQSANVGQVLMRRQSGEAAHAGEAGGGKRPRSRRACCRRGSISRRMSWFA